MSARIMVVEDEGAIALDLKRRLSRLGYDVTCVAASRDEAVAGAAATHPDIILMDINISGPVDGIDTAAEIRSPVIYLTAYSEEKTLARAKATAPYGFLVKPFSERELHATIQMALERHRVEACLAGRERELAEAYAKLEEAQRDLLERSSELFQEKERLLVTLQAIGDGVISTNQHGEISFMNLIAETLTGWSLDDALGKRLSDVLNLIDENAEIPIAAQDTLVTTAWQRGRVVGEGILIARNSGSARQVENCAAPILGRNGDLVGVVLVFRDVSAARRMAAEINYQATHDSLTGLSNRREFENRLDRAIETAIRAGLHHTMAYLDLDQFKTVNDTCGHIAGDELLRQVTALLKTTLRANDVLARLGGDEFGILLESCAVETGRQIMETVVRAIGEFRFVWGEKVFSIGASVGLVEFSGAAADVSVKDILSFADSACYTAKETGRNRVCVYEPDDHALRKYLGEADWFARICAALDQNRFILYGQKIVHLARGEAGGIHMELLIRLKADDGAIVPPMAFIPAAERFGLMPRIDRWVIHSAFNYIARDHRQGLPQYGINLSGAMISDPKALDYIIEQLAVTGVDPTRICFEITETAAISHFGNARMLLHELKKRGCKIALDDFGSGMSSFGYLKQLPVDYLKIDGSFIKDIVENPVDEAFVSAINSVAHVMDIETIAEFVENDAIVEKLRTIGVNYVQGYGIGKPVPLDQLS
ncbi:MAG: EAL domain-containing protein [Methanobacterium sp.]|nr:EAL domain-containing protein [Methanobacterium sp.]